MMIPGDGDAFVKRCRLFLSHFRVSPSCQNNALRYLQREVGLVDCGYERGLLGRFRFCTFPFHSAWSLHDAVRWLIRKKRCTSPRCCGSQIEYLIMLWRSSEETSSHVYNIGKLHTPLVFENWGCDGRRDCGNRER